MIPVLNPFLARLSAAYGPPHRGNEKLARDFLHEYSRHLKNYTPAELNSAADRILEGRKYKTWPTVAECLAAARAAREASKVAADAAKRPELAAKLVKPKEDEPYQAPSPEMRARVAALTRKTLSNLKRMGPEPDAPLAAVDWERGQKHRWGIRS